MAAHPRQWIRANIEHVVLIVQENHTFDSYFGQYCTAPANSNPQCTSGRGCCEAAPSADRAGHTPYLLTDAENFAHDHDHTYNCEVCEIDNGAMDHYTAGSCPSDPAINPFEYSCSNIYNFELANSTLMSTYWLYADTYALADHYFQPMAGSTSGNDMYFATTHYEFNDNALAPAARGAGCTSVGSVVKMSLPGRTTIADVLIGGGFTFKVYADGYNDAYAAAPGCPSKGGDCPEALLTEACRYDPSDIPFEYYPKFTDNLTYMRDLSDFAADVNAGTLPSFSYVKYRTSANEHPGWSYISHGQANVAAIVDAVRGSTVYVDNTLVLLTWDEGGGFYDHVPPPASVETFPSTATGGLAGTRIPYGTRVPMMALGVFAQSGVISHVQMEHSSIVKFLEWNFLGPAGVGAIHATDPNARDSVVNGIGSMLDPTAVGVTVP